jgi:hypothetical protein
MYTGGENIRPVLAVRFDEKRAIPQKVAMKKLIFGRNGVLTARFMS